MKDQEKYTPLLKWEYFVAIMYDIETAEQTKGIKFEIILN